MMTKLPRALKPPLAKPDRTPPPQAPRKLSLAPSAPGEASVSHPEARAGAQPLRCRECGAEEARPAAGWYMLRRRILQNSVPPEVLNEAGRRAWAWASEQRMGIFCSLTCLERSMDRLKQLDQKFREKGVGTSLAERPKTVGRSRWPA
jgi:hypothetical protein